MNDRMKFTPLLLMCKLSGPNPEKYCTPVILARFFYALLSFCVCKFPAKSENQEPRKTIL